MLSLEVRGGLPEAKGFSSGSEEAFLFLLDSSFLPCKAVRSALSLP